MFFEDVRLAERTAIRAVDADLYVIDNGTFSATDGVVFRCVGASCTSPTTLASKLPYLWQHFVASKQGGVWIAQNGPDLQLVMCESQSCAGGSKTLATLGGHVRWVPPP